jgi:hypothetical protein
MRSILKLAFLLLASLPMLAHATAQEPDRIMIEGKEYSLNTNPLSAHLAQTGWTPSKDAVIWSSNWRGYIATWAIEEGQLVLLDATTRLPGGRPSAERVVSIREALFPSQPRVVADWYTGALIIPDGELVDYVHMGYGSSYDHYQVIRVVAGEVIEHLSLDGEAFQAYRAEKFEAFTRSVGFRKILDEVVGKDKPPTEQDIEFIRDFHAEQYLSQ